MVWKPTNQGARIKPRHVAVAVMLFVAVICAAGLSAAEYRPPSGFNGHQWGDPLSSFSGLRLRQANAVLLSPGKTVDIARVCRNGGPSGPPSNEWIALCYFDTRIDGIGSYSVGEYYLNQDSNPWAGRRVALFAITYLFCTSWQGEHMPQDMKEHLTLCGARVMFRSDTHKQLAARDMDYQSNFERILRTLIIEHGDPPGYERGGKITIESGDETLTTPRKRWPDYIRYRWCGVSEFALKLRPTCNATVTLVFDGVTGEGTVLYATAPMYEYAYGRHVLGQENDELYVLLNGRRLDRPNAFESHRCTGTRLCNPGNSRMSAQELSAFQP
jgi:hypothetical protein